MPGKNTIITKASGEKVFFLQDKLRKSLERSGAGENEINQIIAEVEQLLYNGISTKKIYHVAFTLLKKISTYNAARYRLKHAIMELGPSGFPFEKFVGEVLKFQNYKVQLNRLVKGHCVNHEVDLIVQKEDFQAMIECKYHNRPGIKCDVKIPLYINSRFKDVETEWKKEPENASMKFQGWVVTNTKFTGDAIQYGTCSGLYLLGWDYPQKGSLKELIDISGLHPITSLTTLSKNEKERILELNIVLCKELIEREAEVLKIGISKERLQGIINEAVQLCRLA